ncbi:hypothetical protein GCM10023238_21400 [Streptomyces heliomycini]
MEPQSGGERQRQQPGGGRTARERRGPRPPPEFPPGSFGPVAGRGGQRAALRGRYGHMVSHAETPSPATSIGITSVFHVKNVEPTTKRRKWRKGRKREE